MFCLMSTLAEIEAAADALPTDQKQELILFLAAGCARVRANYHHRESSPANKLKSGSRMTNKVTATFSLDSEALPRYSCLPH
jgi:hypothetical protein